MTRADSRNGDGDSRVRSVWQLVAAQASRTPDALAVSGTHSVTYAELAERALSLAARIESAAEPGSLLAVEATTPVAGALSMLAAAHAGCAVLPLTTAAPAKYRAGLFADARPALLLGESGDGEFEFTISNIVGDDGDRSATTTARELHGIAYVMYTSGSTGRPKGVVISQEALVGRLRAVAETPGLTSEDSILAMTAPSFDISIVELLLPLSVGSHFVSSPPGTQLDPALFARTVQQHSPTVLQATPSFWQLALKWGWKGAEGCRIWCGGEALTASLAETLMTCGELWNMYGPTEATIWASCGRVMSSADINLGSPLPGTGWCLEGDDGELVSKPGVAAELLLFGDGLAEGYLDRPELTAARFVTRSTPQGQARCYRTGDRARYTESGGLEFLGRTDGQIKLRGHRIELGELETILEEHPSIRQAVAVLRSSNAPEDTHIAAFLVASDDLTVRDVRRWISDRMPSYMRPGHMEIVASIPRTTAGKADRVRLAADEGHRIV